MRSRAYRPEIPGCLEDRSMLSGIAGPPAHPEVLTPRRLSLVIERQREDFDLFGRHRDISTLRGDIADVVVMIPFERVDGLEATIGRILSTMRRDVSEHVPRAVRSAADAVTAATLADVGARVRSGDVVVR